MAQGSAKDEIKAGPAKDFFIDMIVRDVSLIPAVIDLIDNCIDGAIRTKGDKDYHGFRVHVDINDHQFKISDNCGGIDIELAQNYAFRFGKPSSAETLKHSIGRVGIGMKRALFKIGNHIVIESTTLNSYFSIDFKVKEWRKDEDNWNLKFKSFDHDVHSLEDVGTKIVVMELNEGVSQDFALEPWIGQLIDDIEAKHRVNIEKGMEIKVNQFLLTFTPAELLCSSKLRPAHRSMQFVSPTGKRVTVNIYAGVGESEPSAAGWYVHCNGRLVLRADQSATTGWSGLSEPAMPKYHNQFARFRGYIFFDCDDPAILPWNTSKTGIDEGNEIYRKAKLEMTEMMRPIIDFLNEVDKEYDNPEKQRPLQKLIEKTKSKKISTLVESRDFKSPKSTTGSRSSTIKIKYERSAKKVERAKKVLGVDSAREVGEKTFDIFYRESCEE